MAGVADKASSLRVAILDSFDEAHEEVLAPFIHALSSFPSISLTVFRNKFRSGFKEIILHYFAGPYLSVDLFWNPTGPSETSINNVDFVFLTTGNLDLPSCLKKEVVARFPRLMEIKLVSVIHRIQQYTLHGTPEDGNTKGAWLNTEEGQARLVQAVKEGRLTFLALSPHVTSNFISTMGEDLVANNSKQLEIGTFIPIVPNILRHDIKAEKLGGYNNVVVQGSLGYKNMDRIFKNLEAELRRSPMDWGYLLQANDASSSDEKREIFVPHSGLSHIRFTMHLLGRHYPQAPLAVPDLLRNVIQVERDLPYNEFWPRIRENDLMLTGWDLSQSPYVTEWSGSTVPASIMLRIPVLLSPAQSNSYSYATSPAITKMEADENEVQAIARLRRQGTYQKEPDHKW